MGWVDVLKNFVSRNDRPQLEFKIKCAISVKDIRDGDYTSEIPMDVLAKATHKFLEMELATIETYDYFDYPLEGKEDHALHYEIVSVEPIGNTTAINFKSNFKPKSFKDEFNR